MKPRYSSPNDSLVKSFISAPLIQRISFSQFKTTAFWLAVMSFFLLAGSSSQAQQSGIRFQIPQVRVTVQVGTTNSTVIAGYPITNNTVVLFSGATNAVFDIAGLPAGAGAYLTDTNGNVLTSITGSEGVWLTLNTTNIPEGIYPFTLDAQGFDTNGLPVTNSMTFVLQSAQVWQGGGLGSAGFGVAGYWTNASYWQGGAVRDRRMTWCFQIPARRPTPPIPQEYLSPTFTSLQT